jgi:hypothetical protein
MGIFEDGEVLVVPIFISVILIIDDQVLPLASVIINTLLVISHER